MDTGLWIHCQTSGVCRINVLDKFSVAGNIPTGMVLMGFEKMKRDIYPHLRQQICTLGFPQPMTLVEIFNTLVANPDAANALAAIGSAVLAFIACLISLISLYVAHASLKHQREHNRLSVRPLCYVTLGDYENQLFVKLRNNGTGPMIITSIKIKGARDEDKPLIEAMPALPSEVQWTNFVEDCSGRSVPAGGELVLLELSQESTLRISPLSSSRFVLARDRVREALGKFEIRVCYTDIYGSKLPASVRSLNWFHRNLSVEKHQKT